MSDHGYSPEGRRFCRIPSIVPVDFQLLSSRGEPLDPEIRTAFTRDLSMGGLCLEVRALPEPLITQLVDAKEDLGLIVDIELPQRVLRIPGHIAWRRLPEQRKGLLLGVQFHDVAPADAQEIEKFARRAARRPKIIKAVLASATVLFIAAAALYAWRVRDFEGALADARSLVASAQGQAVDASDKLGDIRVETRWLAVRSGELVRRLEGEKEPATPEGERRSALEELSENLERLNVLMTSRCQTQD